MPGREQAPAHRPAHLAQPDEADRCGHSFAPADATILNVS
jgi:hypothetical protein